MSWPLVAFLTPTKLILLDSLLQEVEATLPHLVFQKEKIKWCGVEEDHRRSKERRITGGVKKNNKGWIRGQIAKSGRIAPRCQQRRLIADGSARIAS
jgi:hypothetical protein